MRSVIRFNFTGRTPRERVRPSVAAPFAWFESFPPYLPLPSHNYTFRRCPPGSVTPLSSSHVERGRARELWTGTDVDTKLMPCALTVWPAHRHCCYRLLPSKAALINAPAREQWGVCCGIKAGSRMAGIGYVSCFLIWLHKRPVDAANGWLPLRWISASDIVAG